MIRDKINKLTLQATIIIASLILGGFFYASQVNKQQSIERQQEVKLQEDRRIEEAKTGQENKEYIAKRKLECYGIYEKERDKWNNVDGSFYREEDDVCVVRYVDDDWKEGDPIFSGLFDADDDGIKETYSAGKYFTKEY